MKITEIKGTITTVDGQTREFSLGTDGGWQQWGNTPEHLGNTVEALNAMAQALNGDNMLVSDYEDDHEGECEKCGYDIERDGDRWRDNNGNLDCPDGGQHYPAED